MAYPEKKDDTQYRRLRDAVKNREILPLYVFHGEESYLKNHYLSELKKTVCGGFDEFNYEFLDGERLQPDALEDAVSTLPMGSERKLVVVRDMKLSPPAEGFKERLPALFADMPEHICLVFLYEGTEFKPDKRTALYKALEAHGSVVEFNFPPASELAVWLRRRFAGLGKKISQQDCEHMLFLCGYSMTNLVTETEKIAAASGEIVTREDIDALASRVLEADVFALTDAVLDGKYASALAILRNLLDLRHEPVAIHAALTRQISRLYGAKLAGNARKSESDTAKMLGLRSNYPAKLMLGRASRISLGFARNAMQKCLDFDVLLKSNVPDGGRTLEIFILQLAQKGSA